ncbi:MAG: hypothetical protein AB8I08_19710 [Sandaracinaceae bacterium]
MTFSFGPRSIRGALALALFVVTATACGLPSGELVVYQREDPELAAASVEDGVWQSAPWSEPGVEWLPYPPRATIQVEHTLGEEPRSVLVYLSFDPRGGQPAMAAGDLARIVAIDAESVSVRNETSAGFFARIVAF